MLILFAEIVSVNFSLMTNYYCVSCASVMYRKHIDFKAFKTCFARSNWTKFCRWHISRHNYENPLEKVYFLMYFLAQS